MPTVTQSNAVGSANSDFNVVGSFNYFDSSLGQLNNVTINYTSTFNASLELANNSPNMATGTYSLYSNATASLIDGPVATTQVFLYDITVPYSIPGNSAIIVNKQLSNPMANSYTDASTLASFSRIGGGSFNTQYASNTSFGVAPDPNTSTPLGVLNGPRSLTVGVSYSYTPAPNPVPPPSPPPNPVPPPAPAPGPSPPPAPCYVTGSHIRVLRGLTIQEVPVERLRVGDLAVTASGKPRPIHWIGSRSYAGVTAPQHDRPVRIKANALGDGVPARDLLVSPDHALMVDGLFVAAGHLVNGTSITRGEAVADLTYWHVELDSHDLLLAENTPAESFLAALGVRAGFAGVQALDAGAAPMPYAPRTELGSDLAALRGRLALRSVSSGEAAGLGPVRAWLDRCVIGVDGVLHVAGWAQDAAQPDAPVCLDVMVDGAVVAFTVASEYRADLAAAGRGDGQYGFDLGLDMPLAPGVTHVVEVRRSTDGSLVCAKQVDAAGAWTALLAA